jgi:NSS family neurotransmitter:Na+ symporter
VGYAISTTGFSQGIEFLFKPSAITPASVLVAMGHAFFTLSLGMGAIMMYGSYLGDNASISKTIFMVAGLDTLVALLAGVAIFPLVFTYGLQPGAGP